MKDRRKGKRLHFVADHENELGNGCYISGFSKIQLKQIAQMGISIHGLEAWIEVPIAALEEQVLSSDDFYIAPNHDRKFKEYTEYVINLAGDKALLYCDWDSKHLYSPARDKNLRAYVKKFGFASLYLELDDPEIIENYKLRSMEELQKLDWTEFKDYLRAHNLDQYYNLTKKAATIAEFKQDVKDGKYSVKSRRFNRQSD